MHALYKSVEDKVAGDSCGCADVFGAREEAVKNRFDLITDNQVRGISGLPRLARLVAEGYTVFIHGAYFLSVQQPRSFAISGSLK